MQSHSHSAAQVAMVRGAQQWGGAVVLLVRPPGRDRLVAAFRPERARPPIECQQSPDPQQVLCNAVGWMDMDTSVQKGGDTSGRASVDTHLPP